MACGGFTCSKNALTALNILYILVAFILIGVAGYSKASSVITSITVIGGIIACGVFLLLLAVVGLIGAIKHHQVLLFFYMVVLFLLFLMQFAIACACLAINSEQQMRLAEEGWSRSKDDYLKNKTQHFFNCCGLVRRNDTRPGMSHPACDQLPCCKLLSDKPDYCGGSSSLHNDACDLCWIHLENKISSALKITGGIGLFFSFTEFIGVWLTVRYRNQKDPRANPSAFL